MIYVVMNREKKSVEVDLKHIINEKIINNNVILGTSISIDIENIYDDVRFQANKEDLICDVIDILKNNYPYVNNITKNTSLTSVPFSITIQFYTQEEILDMDYYDLDKSINNYKSIKYQKYLENHIFDEEESVRWNREMVIEKNNLYKEGRQQEMKLNNIFYEAAKSIIIARVLNNTTDIPISKEGMKILYRKAYEEKHSSGFSNIQYYLQELLEIVIEFNKQEKLWK